MRNTLYGNTPKSLAKAFAIAQTIYYDNQHMHFEMNREVRKMQSRPSNAPIQRFNPNFNYNNMQSQQVPMMRNNQNPNYNNTQPVQQQNVYKPEPMEIDNSGRFKQQTNWRQPNQQQNWRQYNRPNDPQMNTAQKRDYDSSRQHIQTPQKIQRINTCKQSTESSVDNELNPDGYEGDIIGCVPDDLISNSSHISHTASTSLEE